MILKKYTPPAASAAPATPPAVPMSMLPPTPAPPVPAPPVHTKTKKGSAIEKHLASHHIKIAAYTNPEHSELHLSGYLLNEIGAHIAETEDLFVVLRKAIANTNGKFTYNLKNKHNDERQAAEQMLTLLKKCGLFSSLCTMNNGLYIGTLSTALRVTQFLNGLWLEQYCQAQTIRVIREKAAALGLPYEIFSNVELVDQQNVKHEIDLMFSIGKECFAMEQKTGVNFCDYDRYRLIAQWMHLIPDHFMLVNSALTDKLTDKEVAGCISYFYQYFISNSEDFQAVLNQMIDKAFPKA